MNTKIKEGKKSESLIIYHGSPELFEKFNSKLIGSHCGTSEGFGFYLTENKLLAQQYLNSNGYLYEFILNKKKTLNTQKITLTKKELEKILNLLSKETLDIILSNFGDVNYSGFEYCKNLYIESALENNDTDIDIIGDLCNQTNSTEEILETFYKVGYSHYFAQHKSEEVCVVLSNECLTIKTITKFKKDKKENFTLFFKKRL